MRVEDERPRDETHERLRELHAAGILDDDAYRTALVKVEAESPTYELRVEPRPDVNGRPDGASLPGEPPEAESSGGGGIPADPSLEVEQQSPAPTASPKRKAVVIGLVVLTVMAVAGIMASAASDGDAATSPPPELLEPAPDPGLVLIEQAIDGYNSPDNYVKSAFTSISQNLGAYNCGIGFSVDFPDLVLVSLASSSGPWLQVNVDPMTGVQPTSMRSGDDYLAAGLDSSFFANGYTCTFDADGNLSLLGD